MRNIIRKLLLTAAVLSLCIGASFPVFAEEAAPSTVKAAGTVATAAGTAQPPNSTAKDNSPSGKLPSSLEDGYVDAGPGAKKKEEKKEVPKPKETSLGLFTITGYCGCSKCSGSRNLTYSGTVPTANHTISADLSMFPLGTKLKIDGITYTVEDKGSAVKGKTLDIYYDSHEEALAKGMYTAEVFLVE